MQEEPDVLQSDYTVGAGDPFIAGVSLTGPPGGRPSGRRSPASFPLGLLGAGA